MVLYGGKATKRNTVFKNKTSINTSNINNITPSNSGRPSPVKQHTSDWRMKEQGLPVHQCKPVKDMSDTHKI